MTHSCSVVVLSFFLLLPLLQHEALWCGTSTPPSFNVVDTLYHPEVVEEGSNGAVDPIISTHQPPLDGRAGGSVISSSGSGGDGRVVKRSVLISSSNKKLNISCESSYDCTGNLVCLYSNSTNSSICDHCTNNEQCDLAFGVQYVCLAENGQSWCLHKFIWPLNMWDGLSIVILFIGGGIAAGGGIGGGGVFIPVLILVGGFRMKDAIPLSNVMITGAAVANYMQTSIKRHPYANRPLIDYDLSLLIQPLALCGTIVGVLLNTLFPEWLILALLVITLSVTTYRTAKKGLTIYKQERYLARQTPQTTTTTTLPPLNQISDFDDQVISPEDDRVQFDKINSVNTSDYSGSTSDKSEKEAEKEGAKTENGTTTPTSEKTSSTSTFLNNTVGIFFKSKRQVQPKSSERKVTQNPAPVPPPSIPTAKNTSISGNTDPELMKILENERKTPWFKILVLFGVLILVSLQSMLIGGKGDSIAGVPMCSIEYWALYSLIFPILFVITGFVSYYLITTEEKKCRCYYKFSPGDVRWTTINTIITATLSFTAGVLASLLGIGGGMILSPVLLELEVLPSVTAATASYMILFTSFSACVQFAVLKRILWDYGGMLVGVGFISSLIGQTVIFWLVKKYHRKSYFVLCIVIIIGLSTVLLSVTGSVRVADQINHHANLGFNSYCSS